MKSLNLTFTITSHMPEEVKCPQCGSDNLEQREIVSERVGDTKKIGIYYYCKVCGEVFVE